MTDRAGSSSLSARPLGKDGRAFRRGTLEPIVSSRDPGGPALSVCVIMFTSRALLVRCLDALTHQHQAPEFEVWLPYDESLDDPAGIQRQFPHVVLLGLPGSRTPAELRAHAIARSTGRIAALLEDHCIPEPDWCARIVAAHQAPHAAIGGAVEKGFAQGKSSDGILNWSIYLTDYSRYMPPIREGEAASLTDCNVTYKRDALEEVRNVWASEFHENLVNEALRARGGSLWLDSSILVREYRPLSVSAALRDRYRFGRLFASTRVAGAPIGRRLVWAAASGVMPPVLVARAARNLITRRRHRGQIARCLPGLLFVTSVWMFGEMVGYLTASPGRLRGGHPVDGDGVREDVETQAKAALHVRPRVRAGSP